MLAGDIGGAAQQLVPLLIRVALFAFYAAGNRRDSSQLCSAADGRRHADGLRRVQALIQNRVRLVVRPGYRKCSSYGRASAPGGSVCLHRAVKFGLRGGNGRFDLHFS